MKKTSLITRAVLFFLISLCMAVPRHALGADGQTNVPAAQVKKAESKDAPMDIFTALATRRSVRAYTKEPVSDADIKTMLSCAMVAPSAANEQPWEFVVIRDPHTLAKVGDINSYASFAKRAPLAILVCENLDKEKIKGMGILDVANCAENMLLAAHGLGLGAVWTGIYPEKDRIEGFQKLAGLPKQVIPVALIVVGHPEIPGNRAVNRYNPDAVHLEKWGNTAKTGL